MIGQIIVHKEYGKGTIIRTNGDYITVKFSTGERRLKTAELFQFSSNSKEKPIYTQDKSNINVNNVKKISNPHESSAEAAKRKYKERQDAERKTIEESAPDKIAAVKSEIEKLASEKRKKWDAEEKAKEEEKRKAELLVYERNLALRLDEEKKYELCREEEKRESEKRDAVKREKFKQENETRLAEILAEDKIDAERKRALKESRINIRTSEMSKYKDILDKREINYLLHFTRIDNLNSILQNGLVPVNLQYEKKIISIHNDENRLDEQLDCTSFSVGFPNYRLFYKFQKNIFPGTKWVILSIDANILLSSKNAIFFCQTNAASVFPKNPNFNYLCGIEAFEKMFCDTTTTKENKIINRESLNISNECSTDPQAEILISDTIPASYIRYICFPNQYEMKEYIDIFGYGLVSVKNSLYSKKMFAYRDDWEFWKKEKQNGETDLLYL